MARKAFSAFKSAPALRPVRSLQQRLHRVARDQGTWILDHPCRQAMPGFGG